MDRMNDELAVLEPSGSSVTYNGEQITVLPLPIGRIPQLVRVARPVIETVLSLDAIPDENDPRLVPLLLELVEAHGEKVFEAVGICIGKPAEFVGRGGMDEFVTLAQQVWEVNRDFFVLKLAPLLGGRAAAIGKAMTSSGAGQTQSTC